MSIQSVVSYSALAVSVLGTVGGNFFYKVFATSRKKSHLLIALTFFAITPLTTGVALRHIGLDIVYMTITCNIAIIILLSHKYLGERLNKVQWFGVVVLLLGVIIYNMRYAT